jgi:hypothetical protein
MGRLRHPGLLGPPKSQPPILIDYVPQPYYDDQGRLCQRVPMASTPEGSMVYQNQCTYTKTGNPPPHPLPVTPDGGPTNAVGSTGSSGGASSGSSGAASGFSLDSLLSGDHSTLLIIGAVVVGFFMFGRKR